MCFENYNTKINVYVYTTIINAWRSSGQRFFFAFVLFTITIRYNTVWCTLIKALFCIVSGVIEFLLMHTLMRSWFEHFCLLVQVYFPYFVRSEKIILFPVLRTQCATKHYICEANFICSKLFENCLEELWKSSTTNLC